MVVYNSVRNQRVRSDVRRRRLSPYVISPHPPRPMKALISTPAGNYVPYSFTLQFNSNFSEQTVGYPFYLRRSAVFSRIYCIYKFLDWLTSYLSDQSYIENGPRITIGSATVSLLMVIFIYSHSD